MKTAEDIIRKDKYSDLKNLVLICDAMDEFAEAYHTEKLKELMPKLILEGFKMSGEGCNGEHPYEDDSDEQILKEIEPSINEIINKLTP